MARTVRLVGGPYDGEMRTVEGTELVVVRFLSVTTGPEPLHQQGIYKGDCCVWKWQGWFDVNEPEKQGA